MKRMIKVTAILFLLFATFADMKAQEKYEFMTIHYITVSLETDKFIISSEGKETIKEYVKEKTGDYSHMNTAPLLNKIKEYQDQKWEVMNLSMTPYVTSGFIHSVYLKRKKE